MITEMLVTEVSAEIEKLPPHNEMTIFL